MKQFFPAAALCVLPLAAFADEAEDKSYLTTLIEDNLSGDDRIVTVSGFAGALSSEATIDRLTVADSQGVWLTLEDVTLIWTRSALLRGAIDVDELSAARIVVDRAPLPAGDVPPAEATPFALPELPVSIALDKLAIGRIELGESFLGEPLAFGVTGSAALASGQGDVDVAATRLDGKTGTFAIDGSYDNSSRVLDILLDLNEGPAGIVAGLAGLPGDPGVALTLAGNAPLSDFAATLTLATDGVDRVAGDFSLSQTDKESRFAVDIKGDIAPLLAPDYRDFFGNDVTLAANGRQTSAGFDLDELDLSARKLRLTGAASVGADGWPERLALRGTIADTGGDIVLLPIAGAKTFVDRVALNIGYDRSLSDDWTAEFDITGLDRPGLHIGNIGLDGGGVITAGRGANLGAVTANMQYAATGLELDDAGAAQAFGDTMSGVFELEYTGGNPVRIPRLTLTGPGLDLLADATVQGADDGFQTSANVILTATGLDRFATLAGQPALSGAAEMTMIAGTRPLDGTFDVLLNGQTTDLTTGIAQLDPLLRGAGDLSLQAVRDTDGTRLESLRIATNDATVTADANLTSDASSATFDLKLREIALVLPALSGPATLTGQATRNADGRSVFDISGTGPAAQLTATGTVNEAEGTTLNADVTANVTDLTRYQALAGQPLGGAIDLTLSGVVLGDGLRFDADIAAQTRDLRTGIAQLDPLLRGPGALTAQIARTGEDSFRLDGLAITTPAVDLAAVGEGSISGPADATLNLTLTDAGDALPGLNGPLVIGLDGSRGADDVARVTLDADGIGTRVDLDATIAPPAQDYRVAGTLSAEVDNLAPFAALAGQPIAGGLSVDVTGSGLPDLSVLEARLAARTDALRVGIPQADQLLAGIGQVRAMLSRDGQSITVPDFLAQTPQFSASGDLRSDGTTGDARFEGRLVNIGLFTDQLSGPVTANGLASLNADGGWGLDVTTAGPGGIGGQARGTVRPDGTLNMTMNGKAPLGLANSVLEPRRLSGDATIDIAVNGPPALGSLSGRISTAGARLAAPSLGQALDDITGGVTLNGGQAQVDLTGNLKSGGRLLINGPVGLSAPFNGDLSVRLDQITLRDPNLYETTVNGTVTASGPLTGGARIGGVLTLGQTDVQVPSSGMGVLGELPKVVHVGETAATRRTLTRAGVTAETASAGPRGNGPVFPLDVTINAPSRIFIRGRGVDAELGGTLNIGGTSINVIPTGQFDLVRGRINILQQRFDLSEGSATLQGDFVPVIRLVATTEAATGTIIQIIVSGPADAPEVTFQSTPELPQDEVLAQLIFGRNLSEISPLQAVQLASAVATLAGRGGGGLIDNFRQNIGLDDFDVTTDEAGNAAVRAGAYLSENIYTDVTINAAGETEINLNLDITGDITAKGTVDADGETSIGVFFERDY